MKSISKEILSRTTEKIAFADFISFLGFLSTIMTVFEGR